MKGLHWLLSLSSHYTAATIVPSKVSLNATFKGNNETIDEGKFIMTQENINNTTLTGKP